MRWIRRLGGRRLRRGRHHEVGGRGEAIAERYLRRQGWRTLARNARTPLGEVDLVCETPDGAIVAVEVKARITEDPDPLVPARVFRDGQRRRLQRALEHMARVNGWSRRPRRIDLVIIEIRNSGPVIRHFPDAGRSA